MSSKRARALTAQTGSKSDYKVLTPYTGDGSHDDALMAYSDLVNEGINDPTVMGKIAAANLRNLKGITFTDEQVKPVADIEPLFRVGSEKLNGGYVALCRINPLVAGSVTDVMVTSATVTYSINGNALSIGVKNFCFLVLFYENDVLKSCHVVYNSNLVLQLIALDAKIDMMGGTFAVQYMKQIPFEGGQALQIANLETAFRRTDNTVILNGYYIGYFRCTKQDALSASATLSYTIGTQAQSIDVFHDAIIVFRYENNVLVEIELQNDAQLKAKVLQLEQALTNGVNFNQVQADWGVSDENSPAFIQNKPHIPTLSGSPENVLQMDNYGNFLLPADFVARYPADWAANNPNDPSYIHNKPTLFSGSYNDLSDKPTIPTGNGGEFNFEVPQVMGAATSNLKLFAMATIAGASANMNFSWQPASATASGVDRFIIRKGDLITNGGKCKLLHAIINTSQMLGSDKSDVEVVIEDYMGWIPHVTNGATLASTSYRRVPSIEVNAVEGEANDPYSWHTVFSPNFNIPLQYQWANDTDLVIGIYNVKYLNRIAVYLTFNS